MPFDRSLAQDLIRAALARSTAKWLILGSCVGILCGLVGFLFHAGIDVAQHLALQGVAGFTPFRPPGEGSFFASQPVALSYLGLLAVLAGGGALSGWLVQRFAPDARGGGTSAAVRAFHDRQGRIPLAVPLTKLCASIATLGSGGSGGREGPISLIGAGFASWFADRLGLTARDRRILLAAGIAGGVAALFRAPLAGALFAAEVLYSDAELEAEVLIPAFLAAIVAYCSFSMLDGQLLADGLHATAGSLFSAPAGLGFSVSRLPELVGYSCVAVFAAVGARAFIALLRRIGGRFEGMRLPFWARPALGAVAAGMVAIAVLETARATGLVAPGEGPLGVIGSGYGAVQRAFELVGGGPRMVALFALIALAKMLATALTVGSGGSGGVFGPSIAIGGCIGAAVGALLHGLPIAPPIAACTVMGMAGFLAATHRTPIAALLMVSEVIGNYHLLVPAMWTSAVAFLLAGRVTLVAGQVAGPLVSPAHRGHFFTDLLAGIRVAEAGIDDRALVLRPGSTLEECRAVLRDSHQSVFPLLDEHRRLVGVVGLDDLRTILYDRNLDGMVVAQDIAAAETWSLIGDDTLATALKRFDAANLEELPVVDDDDRYLGLASRHRVVARYNRLADELRAQRRAEGYETTGAIEPATGRVDRPPTD